MVARCGLISRDYALVLLAQPFDAQAHPVSRPQIYRGPLPHADSRWRTGGNNVSGLEAHESANVADQLANAKNHRARRSVLVAVAVHLKPHIQVLRVRDFIGRHQPWSDRAEGVCALALDPLPSAF